jgi:hypothetical protein
MTVPGSSIQQRIVRVQRIVFFSTVTLIQASHQPLIPED